LFSTGKHERARAKGQHTKKRMKEFQEGDLKETRGRDHKPLSNSHETKEKDTRT
jgi:hypothetical protein